MLKINLLCRASLVWLLPVLACGYLRQTPQPVPTINQLVFDVQTATPTFTPVLFLADVPTYTPDPNITLTPSATSTITSTLSVTASLTAEPPAEDASTPEPPPAAAPAPTATPLPAPTVPLAEPLRGGVWSFEDGFTTWANPFGEVCPGSGLANGWGSFTTQDQFGSSCFNQTVWAANVYAGESAQEITFAYVGNEAGVFKTAPTIPGHRYTVEAFMRREFSPAKLEVFLGIDLTGGSDWQADTVQWFPWDEDLDDAWARTEETVTATGEAMTIFIRGNHPFPEPGGILRIDAISVVDIGPE